MRDEAVPHLIRAAGEAAVAAYRSYFESASRTRSTRRLYASQAGRFFDWAGLRGLTLETIDAPALAAYAAAGDLGDVTPDGQPLPGTHPRRVPRPGQLARSPRAPCIPRSRSPPRPPPTLPRRFRRRPRSGRPPSMPPIWP